MREEKGGKGGCRLYDTVLVFKASRLAYKCAGEYNTFKVKLINLVVSSFMVTISRYCRKGAWIFLDANVVKQHQAKTKLNCAK